MPSNTFAKVLAASAAWSCVLLLSGCNEPPPLRQRSAVGYEVVERSHHCADHGEECECNGGYILFGEGTSKLAFAKDDEYAKWDVYPKKVDKPLKCDASILGLPNIWSGGDTCRCVHEPLQCEQVQEPWANGCGGLAPKIVSLGMTKKQIKCCNLHDICYSLCGKTKAQCDEDFDQCLAESCEVHEKGFVKSVCKSKTALMSKAVRGKPSESIYSSAQRGWEHFEKKGTDTINGGKITNLKGAGEKTVEMDTSKEEQTEDKGNKKDGNQEGTKQGNEETDADEDEDQAEPDTKKNNDQESKAELYSQGPLLHNARVQAILPGAGFVFLAVVVAGALLLVVKRRRAQNSNVLTSSIDMNDTDTEAFE